MIPLRDDQPTSTFPIVTILIIALNVLVFLVQKTVLGFDASFSMVPYEITHNQDLSNVILHVTAHGVFAQHVPPDTSMVTLEPNDIFLGQSPHPLWITIFTSMFMHANLLHIGGNMLFLWIFGNNIEDALGKARFLFFYFACGLAAAAAQIAMGPNSVIPSLGASGAIAGVLGAYLILYPDARVFSLIMVGFIFFTEIRAYWVLMIWIALQIIPGVRGIGAAEQGGVAYFAHIGGFTAGIILILLMGGKQLVRRQKIRAREY